MKRFLQIIWILAGPVLWISIISAVSGFLWMAAEEHIFAGSLVLQAIGVCIAAPAAEEVIFRGMIFGRLKTILNVPISVFLSALIFALYHGNFLQGLYAGYLGILLAYAAEKKGGLKASVFIHSGANTAAFLLTVFR